MTEQDEIRRNQWSQLHVALTCGSPNPYGEGSVNPSAPAKLDVQPLAIP